jgi:hypothetical protein
MKPIVKSFFDEATNTVTYVVADSPGGVCAIIDPVLDFDLVSARTATISADKVLAYVAENGLDVSWILETHAHADHLSAAQYLKNKVGGRTGIGRLIIRTQEIFKGMFNLTDEFPADGTQFDSLFDDGDILKLGTMSIRVMHTPRLSAIPCSCRILVRHGLISPAVMRQPCIGLSSVYSGFPPIHGYLCVMTIRPRVEISLPGKQRWLNKGPAMCISTKV